MTALVVGAHGFIGRAVAAGLAALHPDRPVRRLVRRPDHVHDPHAVVGDAHDPAVCARALAGVEVAWYLVHSLGGRGAEHRDPEAAARFGVAAARAGVRRLVCVGALGVDDGAATPHVAGRRAVAAALARGGVPVTEIRTAVVVGRGSAVVELFRRMVERMPVLVVPRGAEARVQPVALADLVAALVAAPDGPAGPVELGGPDVVTWRGLLALTAELLGRRPPAFTMPVATPRLSGLFMSAFGPFTAAMGTSFVRGLGRDAVLGPGGRRAPTPLRAALAAALEGP